MGESRRATPFDRDIQQAIIALKKGAHLLKYGRRGKPRFCPFRLSKDERSLIWFSGKEEKQLRLNAVSKIIAGQRTSNFHRQPRPEKEYQSFSLIYGNGDQSLDLICKDKEQAEIWFVGLKALISGTQSHKLYADSWSDGGLQSNASSPAGHTRRKQPFSFVDDIEKFSQLGSNNCMRPVKVQSLYGSPPRQFAEKCNSARPLYSTESQKGFERNSLVNSLHSFPLDLRTDSSKVQIKENPSEGFRVSLSSVISSSSQGSVFEDSDVLGDVLMWGEGIEDGILGGGVHRSGSSLHMQVDALFPKAVQSTVMLDVHRVACGVRHAALVTRKGEIFCWGEENGGRLGHKVDVDVSQPKLVEALANNSIEFVACGEYHTCAISVVGELYIWGDGSHGDGLLGHGSSRSHWLPHRLSGPLDGIRVAKVSCGEWHTAVVASSGVLFTFGDGSFGALGHGDTRSVLIPKQVESLKGLKTITVACGPWHTAAVVEVLPGNLSSNSSAQKLFTWGDGDKGRLGHGDKEKKLVPTCVEALGNCSFVQATCGQTLTVALTASGQVYTMGSRAHGQLGNSQANGKAIVLVEGKLKGEFVEEISSGSFHVAVLTSKGEVYTWGKGANGRLGHGDIEDKSTPTVVEALKDRQVKSISCGSSFTAVICLHKSISGVDQSSCSECKMPFGFTRKRHNCYNCGFVFCHACSNKKATSACLAPNRSKPYRVCDPCYVKLNKVGDCGFTLNGSRSRRLSLMHQTMVSREKSETKTLKSPFFSPKVTIAEKIERFDGDISSKKSKKQELLNLTSTSERWGQVSCPAFFHSNARVHPSPAPILQTQNASVTSSPVSREQSPPRSKRVFPPTSTMYTPTTVLEELKQSNRTLTEEILRLQEQVVETRFATHYIVLKRLVDVKQTLKSMVISDIWAVWRQSQTDRANNVRRLILDEDWWAQIDYLLSFTEPIYTLIRRCDTDKPILGDIYDCIDTMVERVRDIIIEKEQDPSDFFYKQIYEIIKKRWDKMTTPLQLLAYALNPKYYHADMLALPNRTAPNKDVEVVEGYKKDFKKMFTDPRVVAEIRDEFGTFASSDGTYADVDAMADKKEMDPIKWWNFHGAMTTHLQKLAIKLLSQVKNLKQQCESKDAKFEQYECEIEEARALAREETTRCKAAKEVIRVLTGQLKDMADKLPMKTQTSNMSTLLSPHLNALHELLSPTYPGLTEIPEKEDIKFNDHKFYLSPTTRVLRDIRVNGSRSPPVTHDTPTSALGRGFGYQNSARSTEGAQRTGSKIKENINKVCQEENEHPPYTEWVEQDEPGVYFTFVSLADGQKDLKRVRFSRKRFSEREAEEWWTENRLRIHEKYNVEGITGQL